MPQYVDLATIHSPITGGNPPASWGTAVRDDLETLARPPRCRMKRITDLSCPSGANTAVPWTVTDWDTGYDGATPHWVAGTPTRIYMRRTGIYLLTAQGLLSATAAGTRSAHFQINGIPSLRIANYTQGSGVTVYAGNLASEIALTAGDYVEYTFFQDSGVNLTVLGASYPLTASIRWLGPL